MPYATEMAFVVHKATRMFRKPGYCNIQLPLGFLGQRRQVSEVMQPHYVLYAFRMREDWIVRFVSLFGS